MGDRANIAVRFDPLSEETAPPRVYLYGHWSGETYAIALQRALAKRWRWDDAFYLTRIIYDEFVGSHAGTETGFGISPYVGDNEHPVLLVDPSRQMVFVEYEVGRVRPVGEPKAWTFEQYVALPDAQAAVSA